MSEIPERLEREMFEIRSRMSDDVRDLKQHVSPQTITKQVKKTVRERVQGVLNNLRAKLKLQQQQITTSAKGQLGLAREAGENRDPSKLTDAVKSDPRPAIILAVALAFMLLTVRRVTASVRD